MAHEISYISDKKCNIDLVRGDSFIVDLNFKKGDSVYEPGENDMLTFTVRRNYKGLPNDDILLQKKVNLYDAAELELEPSDTESMDYGSYKYDMEFDYADGRVDTALQGVFKLVKEVT